MPAGLAVAAILGVTGLGALVANAQTPPASGRPTSGDHSMSQHSPGTGNKPRPPTASTTAYRDAATQLQREMGIPYSGDADKDFAALLAAYQKGAAAIARIELEQGTDPELRRLAEQVLAANSRDLSTLQAWQNAHK